MIDHLSLGVTDVARSREFYDAALAVLGYKRLYDHEDVASAYGTEAPRYRFWIGLPLDESRPARPCNGTHVCFQAASRAAVEAFHEAALANGGRDAGSPGLRPEYMETYYAAFAFDPDGHKVEAVCHAPG